MKCPVCGAALGAYDQSIGLTRCAGPLRHAVYGAPQPAIMPGGKILNTICLDCGLYGRHECREYTSAPAPGKNNMTGVY